MNIRQTDSWKRAQLAVLQVVAKGETKKIRELRKRLDKENDAAEISSLISAIHALEEYMEKGKAAREKRKKDKADKLKAAPPPDTAVASVQVTAGDYKHKGEDLQMDIGGEHFSVDYEVPYEISEAEPRTHDYPGSDAGIEFEEPKITAVHWLRPDGDWAPGPMEGNEFNALQNNLDTMFQSDTKFLNNLTEEIFTSGRHDPDDNEPDQDYMPGGKEHSNTLNPLRESINKVIRVADAIIRKDKPNPMGPGGPKMQPRYELENEPKAGMCEACGMPMEACACMASAEACPACGSTAPANDDGSCVDCRCDKATKDALNNEKHSASPKNEKPPVEDVCPDCGADIGSCGCKNYARADADPGQMAQLVALVVSQVESYRANHANNEPLEAVLDKILQEVRQEALDTASDSVWELQHPAEQPAV